MSVENDERDSELLKNIKRLTVRVLDNLEEGLQNRTLDEQQKRLVTSSATRLLRLWRMVEKEGETKRAAETAERINALSSKTNVEREGTAGC